MSKPITYLITGANRGIGLALTSILLLRTNTTVIATVRSASTATEALQALPHMQNSKVIIAYLSTSAENSPAALLKTLTETHNITKIDVLILNAGMSEFAPILSTTTSLILETLQVNTLLPITLFQTLHPLLEAARFESNKEAKVIYISSYLGSIGGMEESPSLAYGMSKAAANYFVRKIHFEHEGVISLAVHPGWLKTENGQNYAEAVGAAEAPMEVDDAALKIIIQIDDATKEATSGSFVRWDGEAVPW